MLIEFDGRRFELVYGTDIQRDGAYLEVSDVLGPDPVAVLDAFHWDADGRITVSAYREDLPFELVEWFTAEVRRRLAPAAGTPDRPPGSSPSRPAG